MGCGASKPSREGGGGHAHGEQWQKGSTSPTTPLPKLLPGQSASIREDQAGTPTTSDASTCSHSSQLSTWDMRTMQGPITTSTTSTKKPAPASTIKTAGTDHSQPPAIAVTSPSSTTTTTPIAPSLAALQISLPSFSQRMRSPSILGTPALDTPLALPPLAPTERLVVTKIGGCTLVNQYLVVQYLGRGTSGKVYLCIDVFDRRLYAVKIVRKTPREEKQDQEVEEEAEDGVGGEGNNEKEAINSAGDSSEAAGSGNTSTGDAAPVILDGREKEERAKEKDEATSSLNKQHEKFAAKAAKMKQKAALRNKNTTTPLSDAEDSTPTSKPKTNSKKKIKKINRDPLIDLRREVEILRNVGSNHPNVVSLREIVDDPTSNKMLIVMEYCEGGPVMTRAGLERGRRIPESVARPYFRDMIAALGHLHRNRVIHGDLKPENALMSANGRIALSDFGCSKILPDVNPKNDLVDRCNGTPAFLAPEMMTPGATFRGRPADVYALGACLFTFIFGRIPFTAESVAELFKIVKTQELSFPDIPADASQEVKALLRGLLAKDPEARMTLEKAAKHRWTTDQGRLPPVEISSPPLVEKNKSTINNNSTSSSGVLPTNFFIDDPHILDGDASLAGLLSCSGVEIVNFLPGQVLIRQGDRSTSMMYILQGEVDVLYRPSEDVMNAAQQRGNSNTSNSGVEKDEKEERESIEILNQKGIGGSGAGGGGGGIGGAITKLWSPSARLKRSARDNRTIPTPTTTANIPSLDLQRAKLNLNNNTTIGAFPGVSPRLPPLPPPPPPPSSSSLSARSTGNTPRPLSGSLQQPSSTSLISPRERSLMLGLGNTPEPSPRFPLHSTATSTGALSTSFQLTQGIGVGSHALDSAVTTPRNTPAVTPLPSARGSASAPDPQISITAGGGEGGGDDRVENNKVEREATPFFTPLPDPSTGINTNSAAEQVITNDVDVVPNFSTPAAAAAPLVVKTPGSGDQSKLAAYPLVLTPRDFTEESGDLDKNEKESKNNVEPIPSLQKSLAGVAGEAEVSDASSSQILVPPPASSSPTPPIHTIREEEEILDATSSGGVGNRGGGDYLSQRTGAVGLPRPDSGTSWAPQAQLSRAFSAQTEGIDIEQGENTSNDVPAAAVPRGVKKGFNAEFPPTTTNIPCALEKAAEEAGGFIQSLYRDTHSSNINIGADGSGSDSRKTRGEYLLAVRGAGDFIGETALIGGSSVRRSCSVRASSLPPPATIMKSHFESNNAPTTPSPNENANTENERISNNNNNNNITTVQVAVIPYSVAKEYLKTNPLAKQRLAEMVWSRQSETIVLEGLLRLAGISRELHEEARKHSMEI